MRTAFATVIYKQAKPFLKDFIDSVYSQTDTDFELLLINDNYEKEELGDISDLLKSGPIDYQIIDLREKHLSIAGTRIEMLKHAKDLGYDLLVLGDADDTFSEDRVLQCKNAYKTHQDAVFFYNKLITDKGYDVFDIPDKVTNIKDISQSNFLGMSTSAIRMSALSMDFIDSLKEGDSPVFDWYLFSRLVLDIGRGVAVKDAATIYRIYDNNMVGVSRDVKKEYEVKKTHYNNLAKRYDYFRYLLEQLKNTDIDNIKENDNYQGYWWSDIKMEDSYEI